MKLFLDTANIQEIRDGVRMGVISGVTTNPSLAASEGIGSRENYKEAVQEISDILELPLGTIKSRLHRARTELTTRLRRNFKSAGESNQ